MKEDDEIEISSSLPETIIDAPPSAEPSLIENPLQILKSHLTLNPQKSCPFFPIQDVQLPPIQLFSAIPVRLHKGNMHTSIHRTGHQDIMSPVAVVQYMEQISRKNPTGVIARIAS